MSHAGPHLDDILAARALIGPILGQSPTRRYPLYDDLVGHGVRLVVKHENHLPVNSFKLRNALTALLWLDPAQAAREVIAVQSEAAHAQHDAWHDGRTRRGEPVSTFAEGIACGSTYETTFDRLRHGLDDFVLVREEEIAQGVRDLLQITHNVAEGAGAAGWPGPKCWHRDWPTKRLASCSAAATSMWPRFGASSTASCESRACERRAGYARGCACLYTFLSRSTLVWV